MSTFGPIRSEAGHEKLHFIRTDTYYDRDHFEMNEKKLSDLLFCLNIIQLSGKKEALSFPYW
jgi:hypothetical protein